MEESMINKVDKPGSSDVLTKKERKMIITLLIMVFLAIVTIGGFLYKDFISSFAAHTVISRHVRDIYGADVRGKGFLFKYEEYTEIKIDIIQPDESDEDLIGFAMNTEELITALESSSLIKLLASEKSREYYLYATYDDGRASYWYDNKTGEKHLEIVKRNLIEKELTVEDVKKYSQIGIDEVVLPGNGTWCCIITSNYEPFFAFIADIIYVVPDKQGNLPEYTAFDEYDYASAKQVYICGAEEGYYDTETLKSSFPNAEITYIPDF